MGPPLHRGVLLAACLLAAGLCGGPVRVHGFVKSALSGQGAPTKDKGLAFMLGGLIKRGLGAYMAGTARHSPFFDAAGAPVSVPHVLTGDERRAAYAD